MKLTNKTARWDYGETWVGRKKHYEVRVILSDHPMLKEDPYWFFTLMKGNYHYNSLSDNLKYTSMEECAAAAEIKVDELAKERGK